MTNFTHFRQVLAATLAFGLAAPTFAQEAAPEEPTETPASKIDPAMARAHEVALSRLSQELSHESMAGLQLAAWSASAAGLCVDLELDEARLYADLVQAAHDDLPDSTPEEQQQHRDFSLIAFGVLTGLRLQEAAKDEAAFCAEAILVANEMGDDSYVRQVSEAVLLPSGN